MLNIIKKTKIKSEGRQPFLTEGGVWLMCLHLTLPSSSAATVGYPTREGRINYEAQRAWKNCTEKIYSTTNHVTLNLLRQQNFGNKLLITQK